MAAGNVSFLVPPSLRIAPGRTGGGSINDVIWVSASHGCSRRYGILSSLRVYKSAFRVHVGGAGVYVAHI